MTQAVALAQQASTGVSQGFKNRIINGAMTIDQRNAGASVTVASGSSQFSVDRWNLIATAASKFTVQQNAGSVTPPAGFTNYLGVTSSSAYSVGAGDVFAVRQFIEGFNTADLNWGTANAKTITLSFWVRSSLTGTFGGNLQNQAQTQAYPFSYTISSANTWEQKSITIAGSTTAVWETGNQTGMQVAFSIGSGSTFSGTAGAWVASNIWSVTGATSVVGTNGATFYITGVQLEVGSTATSFDTRSYGTELGFCQRYYYKASGTEVAYGCLYDQSASRSIVTVPYHVTMRTNPSTTITYGSGTANSIFGTADTCYVYVTVSGGSSSYLTAFAASAEL
jgi:hypothetical protein